MVTGVEEGVGKPTIGQFLGPQFNKDYLSHICALEELRVPLRLLPPLPKRTQIGFCLSDATSLVRMKPDLV